MSVRPVAERQLHENDRCPRRSNVFVNLWSRSADGWISRLHQTPLRHSTSVHQHRCGIPLDENPHRTEADDYWSDATASREYLRGAQARKHCEKQREQHQKACRNAQAVVAGHVLEQPEIRSWTDAPAERIDLRTEREHRGRSRGDREEPEGRIRRTGHATTNDAAPASDGGKQRGSRSQGGRRALEHDHPGPQPDRQDSVHEEPAKRTASATMIAPTR